MGARILMALLVLVSMAAAALAAPPVSAPQGVAVQGHDPVAYFTENRPIKGDVNFSHQWKGAIWLFSSARNRALFVANPDRYAPQYGGYCSLSVAYGKTAHGAAEAWHMHNGKLYLNATLRVREQWSRDIPGNVAKADGWWPRLVDR